MKYLLYALLILIFISPLPAGDVSLAWDHSSSQGVTGYKVYFGNASRTYGEPITIGYQNTFTVTAMRAGEYFFTVTAVDAAGNESGYSNEVSAIVGSADISPPAEVELSSLWVSGPLPIDTTGTSIKLSWKTSRPCTSRIEFTYQGGTFSSLVVDLQPVTDHFVRLTDLRPGTLYTYEVYNTDSSGNLAVASGSFRTK